MPQMLASFVAVIIATVYLFQTFGGTSDKLDLVAQKSVVIGEIENIKKGLQFYMSFGKMDSNTSLEHLANLSCFAPIINEQLKNTPDATGSGLKNFLSGKTDNHYYGYLNASNGPFVGKQNLVLKNTYSAISFGSREKPSLLISLILKQGIANTQETIPGIRVQLLGKLEKEKAWMEKQIVEELRSIAYIDVVATWGEYTLVKNTTNKIWSFNPSGQDIFTNNRLDGIFTLYFKDLVGVLSK